MNSSKRSPRESTETRQFYEFGPFVLDTVQHLLLKDGEPVGLTPKTYDALLVLAQNSGRMLSKEDLMSALWPDSFVEESNLTQQISMIRKALGETPGDDRYIVTVPGRGYRFAAPVRSWSEVPVETAGERHPELVPEKLGNEGGLRVGAESDKVLHMELRVPAPIGRQETHPAPSGSAPSALQTKSDRTRGRRPLLIAAVIAGLGAAAVLGYVLRHRAPGVRPSSSEPRSLAILPFENLRRDANSAFLGFSLADAVVTKLGYVSSLTVRPSSATEKYRDQVIDIRKVAADLEVDTLLTGTFFRDGDELRITSQLVDVKSQKILWKGSFDRKYERLLTVQDDVAHQIINGLELNLSAAEAARLKPELPVDPMAYEYYLRGVDLDARNEFPLAIRMLEKSTEIDPRYAPTWAQLGRSYSEAASFQFGGGEQYEKARAAYERALSLEPDRIETKIHMANLLTDTGRVEEAIPLLRDAIKTNPNHADAHWELGYAYRHGGMLEESVKECERARELDPGVKVNSSALNSYLYLGEYDQFLQSLPQSELPFILFYRGFGEYYKRDWQAATADFARAFELDPTLLQAQVGKALSLATTHENATGLAMLKKAEAKVQEKKVADPEAIYKIAQAYSVLDDKGSALRLLRYCIDNGFFPYSYFRSDPLLDNLRAQPEFARLMETAHQREDAFRARFA